MTDDLIPILNRSSNKRQLIREKVIEGLQESFPIESRNKTLKIDNLRVEEEDYSPTEQKKAILRGNSLFEAVKGTVRMLDKDGKEIDKLDNFTVARIPWFTPRATLIIGGNEYAISNQVRPKPGVYARKRSNGVIETNFNIQGGPNFNVTLDAEKGEPQLEYGATKIPLYPILREAGVSHEDIRRSWGTTLADDNAKRLMSKKDTAISKLYSKVIPEYHRKGDPDSADKIKEVFARYAYAKMDGEVNEQTLGARYETVTPDTILAASKKLLNIHRKASEIDDRDSLDFKALHSPEDFFKEVIKLNSREVARKTAIKMEAAPSLRKALPAGPFTKGLLQFVNNSQLVAVPTATNPVELVDASMRVTALGEGGISTERAIPEEARHIHTSQMAALDPFRTPETFRAGVDVRAAMGMKKDRSGNIYVPLRDLKDKKHRIKYVRTSVLSKEPIALPGQDLSGTIDGLKGGKLTRLPASAAKYQIPHSSMLYSPTTNLIPFMESLQGNRVVMGSKMQTQALSLVEREAPYVQVMSPDGKTYEEHMASIINPYAVTSGTVKKIDGDYIYIQPDKEKTAAAREKLVKIPYEKNFPLAAKTYLDHTLNVKEGDRVTEGQQLGDSNFTRNGVLALGKNMRVAYMPYHGMNSNDAIVISEGAAKKLTSERMYKFILPIDNDMVVGKDRHRTYYGQNYTKDSYNTLDNQGVIKPGTKVVPGDPLFLSLRKSTLTTDDVLLGRLHKSLIKPYRESTQTWDHDHPGEVVDVEQTGKRVAITVKTQEPVTIGDKLSGRFGNKGVVSEIVPDDQMVQDESGAPIDILMTPAGVVSRTNPAVIIETAVGKVAEKTGKPIKVENLTGRDNVKWAKSLLKENGLSDKETVFDPVTGKKIPKVFVGRQYILKLMKSTDTNYSARGIGAYDVNQQPVKGGDDSAKAIGKMEFDVLVGHNARNVLKESANIKSQKNDEYWRALQLGLPSPPPKTAFAADKLFGMLTGAGVRVKREGSLVSLAPLTDDAVVEMSSGEIKKPLLLKAKDLQPETGGLFDPAVTGGLTGKKWSHITLAEPVVNPVFKEPVRRLLGVTGTKLDALYKEKGGKYIQEELSKIDLDKKEKDLLAGMEGKSANRLDDDIKQLKFIRALKEQNLTPDKAYIVSKIPVLPPMYRPVLPGKGNGELLYGDVNPLYRDLLYTNEQFKEVKKSKLLPDEEKNLRPALIDAVGAVYGTNDPVSAKSKARGHKGFLTYISGVTSPKEGYFQSKIMKRNQDFAGRGTIVPDNTLGMDEVGLPEDMLWDMYSVFIIKRLVQSGFSPLEADKMVKSRAFAAKNMLEREIKDRPVMINRAPSLHRYNMVGAYPKMVPGKTIRINPFVEAGTNSDYDGDTMMIHTPVSNKAINEVKQMTLSNLLYSDKARNDLLVFPKHEAIMGIAAATSVDDKNTKPVKFKTEGEALKAYREGKITLGTRVKIGEK